MTTYRLMDGASGRPGVGSSGTQPPAAPTAYSGNFLAGTQFGVTGQVMWLQGYWWWCPTGGDTGAQKFCLWNVTSGTPTETLVPNSTVTSGTLTAGAFNYVALATPIQLAPGAQYVAATGWSAVHGFPDSNNQFADADPYESGITNGPLVAWADPTAAGHFNPPYSLYQGLFSVAGTDPTVHMPNAGSNSANFWVDVQVSDTAPSGYSGSYRLWPNMGDAFGYSNDTANNFTLGMEFSLSSACDINNVWFYSPSGVTQLPTEIGVYEVSGPTLAASNSSPSWSGAAGSGWVKASLSGTLSASVNYKVVVLNAAGSPAIWNGASALYWSTGAGGSGITAGPITAPDNAGATSPGQDTYNAGATITYPATNVGPYNYWVDIEVTPASPSVSGAVATAALAAPAGSVTAGATLTGTPATAALAAPAGTVTAGAVLTGTPAAAAFAAPAGSVSAGATVTGAVATAALAAPAGSAAAGGAGVTGTPATAALAAPAGSVSAGATLTGTPATAALAAPAGTVSAGAVLTGAAATAALTAPAGSLAIAQTGTPAAITFAAPPGTATAGGSQSVTGTPAAITFAAPAGTVTAEGAPQKQGSWWQLLDILAFREQEFEFYADRPPVACPNDGEPLRLAPPTDSGSGVELYCPFDGWQYPRDWIRPMRL